MLALRQAITISRAALNRTWLLRKQAFHLRPPVRDDVDPIVQKMMDTFHPDLTTYHEDVPIWKRATNKLAFNWFISSFVDNTTEEFLTGVIGGGLVCDSAGAAAAFEFFRKAVVDKDFASLSAVCREPLCQRLWNTLLHIPCELRMKQLVRVLTSYMAS